MTFEYENICFEGGGIHGYAYCGAVKALDELGYLNRFQRYAGSSVGSLVATMLSCGFTADEVIKIPQVFIPALAKITSHRGCCGGGNLFDLAIHLGLYETKVLEAAIEKLLAKRVSLDSTLSIHYQTYKKELVIISCCVNRKEPVYFHHATYPNVTLRDALIASMAVPIFFRPRKLLYNGYVDYFVDGGLVDNYPLWIFNDLEALYSNNLLRVSKSTIDPKTLGLKLYSPNETHDYHVQSQHTSIKGITAIFHFLKEIVNTMHVQLERGSISQPYIEQTIPIRVPHIHFLNFDPDLEIIQALVASGKESVLHYFSTRKTYRMCI